MWKMGHEKHRSCRYTELKPYNSSCTDNLLCKEQIIDYARMRFFIPEQALLTNYYNIMVCFCVVENYVFRVWFYWYI